MKRRHPVDRMAADRGEVRHAHVAIAGLVEERQAAQQPVVPGEPRSHGVEEAPVDLVDDLQVPRQDLREERKRPFLQRFGEQRVVRIAARPLGDAPGLVPWHQVLVDEQPHQLGDGDRRMRVVELHRPVAIELVQPLAAHQVQADHVLQRAGDEEELLHQTELLADLGLVVRVEDLGDGFGRDLLVDGPIVVADVERIEVERLGRFGLPEAQQVGRRRPVAGHRRVVGHAFHQARRQPTDPFAPLLVAVPFGASAELHVKGRFRPDDLPRVAESQPLVGQLDLPAVPNRLVEDAELVADAVADRRHIERRQRIHVAGGQAAEPAVAEAGFLLLLEKRGEVLPDLRDRLFGRVPQAQVDQAVPEVRACQEFGGQVCDHLDGLGAGERLDGRDVAVEQAIADRVGERHVPVVACRVLRQLGLDVVEVVEQRFGQGLGLRADAHALTAPRRFARRAVLDFRFHRVASTAPPETIRFSFGGGRRQRLNHIDAACDRTRDCSRFTDRSLVVGSV